MESWKILPGGPWPIALPVPGAFEMSNSFRHRKLEMSTTWANTHFEHLQQARKFRRTFLG